jgi:shikimate kinase
MSGLVSSNSDVPSSLSRIVLTGFMGAGKSTVGAQLASRLGWKFLDSDHLIEGRTGTRIARIFADRGEAVFRALEAEVIGESVVEDRVVLALGGGAIETADTRNLLASLHRTLIVFLEAPLPTLVSRCCAQNDGPVRPILADSERLEERWQRRQAWYREAHLIIPTRKLTPEAVVDRILCGKLQIEAAPTGQGVRA